MAFAITVLPGHVELQRRDQLQVVARAGHRDVEQPPLLLDLRGIPGGELAREVAVHDRQQIHAVPFLALGGVHRRQDQIVLVEVRWSSLVARCLGRVQDQLGQEAFA